MLVQYKEARYYKRIKHKNFCNALLSPRAYFNLILLVSFPQGLLDQRNHLNLSLTQETWMLKE